MRRNKFGALLIATQMAVTLAFLANALTLIEQRLAWSNRPSGMAEADIFVMQSETIDHPGDLAARQASDIAALRALVVTDWELVEIVETVNTGNQHLRWRAQYRGRQLSDLYDPG